jgi:hypothetical protein
VPGSVPVVPYVAGVVRRSLALKITVVVIVAVVTIGCGESDDGTGSPGDEATKQELTAADAALQQAADELSPEEFARFQSSVIRQRRREPAKLTTTRYLALVQYLAGREIFFAVALAEPADQVEVDRVLSGIEFNDDPRALTLIAPPRLGHRPPADLIEAGVTFAAISPSGQIFCLSPGDEEPQPCDPPDRPS